MNHKWDYRATVKLIVLFAGKRKSGKDYVTDRLRTRLPADVSAAFVHISAPIKRKYAEMHSLDFDELMSTSSYKEAHRAAMVVWSDEQRRLDDGCFIRPALEDADPDGTRNVWVVVDTRRESDVDWFRRTFGKDRVRLVLVRASEVTRRARGWTFTLGIDDAETECGLDAVTDWNLVIDNDGDEAAMARQLDVIVKWCSCSAMAKD